ncbi:MAG: YtxH domain-containing protein [Patescibacteria group bacterium]|nr:YtxH domain-containing protein [Patescibacteria group bacterium]MDD5121635.1 YtxH domain-containing protein [Patescibacteria group bacterium]MDD5221911.1 YtxH domain-containing protein [Patescibacteria group bacterium]MDD5396201.1 YtxH domain-containing protein [Patescibacteria group bacterium]
MSFKRTIKAGFFGALAGIIAGLFLAKKSGKELKEDLKVKGEELKSKAGEIAETMETKAKETIEEVKKDLSDESRDDRLQK